MTKIILSGCNGKMGQVITQLLSDNTDTEIVAGIDINDCLQNTYPVFCDLEKCDTEADVIVDFSHPSAFDKLMDFANRRNLPIVVATTGLSKEQKERLKKDSENIPVFFSANMSLGINLLIALSKKAARVLGEGFDIEIIEQHHNQKIDAPSGTALALADGINEEMDNSFGYVYDRHAYRKKRDKKEIGIHAIRGGTIVGKHDVIFAGNDEVITLKHEASSKEVFAVGAVKAAQFMAGKPKGFYSMDDLIGGII
ncbi:MAG: 4-hydroxy-tetrahydrodipicolinate reductase [Clostridia bacterium]|nr:4-hydroxy-tetrahydrodipicolinate reductase [Clostridia bacterium]